MTRPLTQQSPLEWMVLPQMVMATGLGLHTAALLLGEIQNIGTAS